MILMVVFCLNSEETYLETNAFVQGRSCRRIGSDENGAASAQVSPSPVEASIEYVRHSAQRAELP